MNLKKIYILFSIITTLTFSSCIFENGSDCPDQPDSTMLSDGDVYLNLTVGVLSGADDAMSRADDIVDDENYFEGPDSKYEQIKTLRIIIVRGEQNEDTKEANVPYLPEANGIIEHNRLFKFSDDGGVLFDNLIFKVHSGEDKTIYLIANEAFVTENAGINFDELVEGTDYNSYNDADGGFIERIELTAKEGNNILINNSDPDKCTFIPMSEVFDFNVPFQPRKVGKPVIEEIKKTFFLTRAAVKFSFSIAAVNGGIALGKFENYYVTDVTFNQIADREYLLPRDTEYSPDDDLDSDYDFNGRFITSYTIPPDASHNVLTFQGRDESIPRDKDTPLVWSVPYYFCESQFNPSAEKPYSISITVKAKDADGNWINDSEYTFEAATLQNLSLLPRNTHVRVVMQIWKYDIEAMVTLVPYIGVNLHPSFGF